ncbi:hypothetical protein SLEP1_g23185 [Rubroshorea leprosula]|uniref:Uncharacterized protein n=1 Tax=Rubroshorea leprosula TaxID=152421 RepID=A0AAV5JBJ7_9ROSI|nr:hypothetical protein SLEP1_g23185 [Rubroshorea leprosula]
MFAVILQLTIPSTPTTTQGNSSACTIRRCHVTVRSLYSFPMYSILHILQQQARLLKIGGSTCLFLPVPTLNFTIMYLHNLSFQVYSNIPKHDEIRPLRGAGW